MSHRPWSAILTTSLMAGFWLAGAAFSQTMVEYGHLAGGAANSAAALRQSSPARSLAKLKGTLSQRPSTTQSASYASAEGMAPVRTGEAAPGEPLTVVRVQWGAATDEESAATAVEKTAGFEDVSGQRASNAAFDPLAAGLEQGMTVPEVSKILGDPAYRTSGLAGRGYDEKVLYQIPSGWRVVVFAANGLARDFLVTKAPEKTSHTAQSVLPNATRVVP